MLGAARQIARNTRLRKHGALQKGQFKGKFQGYGEEDQIEDMFLPEARTGWTPMERIMRRPNSADFDEVYESHWAWKHVLEGDAKEHLDQRYDQYVRDFGFKPEDYFERADYFAKYGTDEAVWHSWVRNNKRSWPSMGQREACYTPSYTRKNCCPLHRDVYLLPHYKNTKLLKQFIDPTTGNIMTGLRTGCCLQAEIELGVALQLAWQYGYLLQPLHTYQKRGGWGFKNNLDWKFQHEMHSEKKDSYIAKWLFDDDDSFY